MTNENFPHLRNAPATEAVIDIRTKPSGAPDLPRLLKLTPPGFSVEDFTRVEAAFAFSSGEPPRVHQTEVQGYRFVGSDKRVVVTATPDGIATSRLQPYTEWGDLVTTAKEFWSKYVELSSPAAAVRLGVRYINRLDLPVHVRDLGTYLESPPQFFPGTTGSLTGFLKRTVTAGDAGTTAVVTQAIQESKERRTVVILDIDCYYSRPLAPNDSKIWQVFADLRVAKNRIFFSNITAEARTLYQ